MKTKCIKKSRYYQDEKGEENEKDKNISNSYLRFINGEYDNGLRITGQIEREHRRDCTKHGNINNIIRQGRNW